jgi:hypothetical protein
MDERAAGHQYTRKPSWSMVDDLVPVIDSFDFLTPDQKLDMFSRNAHLASEGFR